MANYSDIQHRFANKLEGKNGVVRSGNVRYEGRNFYSYFTVFGQWADISKNVVLVFDGNTSTSSSRHMLGGGLFPDDVNVFPYDDGGGYYSWHGCNLLGSYFKSDEAFTFDKRCALIDYYVESIYEQFKAINGGKKKGLENVNFDYWGYVEKLCSLYRDTTINKWIEHTKKYNGKEYVLWRKLAKMLKSGERDVQTITDALFGEGTFKKYWDYCARYRKSADRRAKVEMLCERLGIKSPYVGWGRGLDTGLSADEIRKLTAKQRNEYHFESIMRKEWNDGDRERIEKFDKNKRNAYKWVVGYEPVKKGLWSQSYEDCDKVRNMWTDEVYEVERDFSMPSFMGRRIEFDYLEFRNAENKEQWIQDFYTKCHDYAQHRKALQILKRVGCPTREKKRSWDNDQYIDCELLRQNTTDEEYAYCVAYISVFDAHKEREKAEERAMELARKREEEERKREEEFKAQVKKEQIAECVNEGSEGCRNLWRKHLTDNFEAERYFENVSFNEDGTFYYGGNVLMRFNLDKTIIETSKSIRINIPTCKAMWRLVKMWHENPNKFKNMEIKTLSGTYTISSYEDDIMTAGCHKIAYAEMERMYNEIIENEIA